jgi:hypothetical protein
MENLSLKHLLSLLLPGMFMLFCSNAIGLYAPPSLLFTAKNILGSFSSNEFLAGSFYLLVAILLGSATQGLITIVLNKKWYNEHNGLFARTGYVFNTIPMLQQFLPFYNTDCKTITGHAYNGADINAENKASQVLNIQGQYFDYIFYYLLLHEKNEEPHTEQGFYFLYRSLYFVALCMGIVTTVYAFISLSTVTFKESFPICIMAIAIFAAAFILFRPVAIWYRKRMVRTLFYLYYIHKNSSTIND